VSIDPKPTDAGAVSNYRDYLPADEPTIAAWEKMMAPVISRSAELLAQRLHRRTGNLLDVGCGYGFFPAAMKNRGWTASGIEISATGRRYAQQHFGLTIYGKPLTDVHFAEHSFDVVTLFYVIEHLLNPVAVLQEVRRILKPGGIVLLRWPNTTPIIKLLGRAAHHFDLYHTPYHLHDFSPATMRRLLLKTGFIHIETRIGGVTHPERKALRIASVLTGLLGESVFRLSMGKYLLPGVSKTTLAERR
jgi:2-polyprenyl-3-methyl-5-hydroxy-6-metoxy-1,4-benzoquinol methylase